jgi:hypothetical protein
MFPTSLINGMKIELGKETCLDEVSFDEDIPTYFLTKGGVFQDGQSEIWSQIKSSFACVEFI